MKRFVFVLSLILLLALSSVTQIQIFSLIPPNFYTYLNDIVLLLNIQHELCR